jgi:GntR family transcriptional regulator
MTRIKLVPLYHQIYLTLRNEILTGAFSRRGDSPAAPMPSENELADRYSVSRVTIRRALKALETDGLIVRRHGAGTFPTGGAEQQGAGATDGHYGHVHDLVNEYDQTILAYDRIATPPFLHRKMADFGDRCLHLAVLSKRRNQPIHLNHQFVPERLGDLLGENRPKEFSLLLELKKHGVIATRTGFELTAAAADLDAANHLEVPAGSPLIATARVSRAADGTPVEYFEALTRPDHYIYRFELVEAAGQPAFRQV